MLEVLWGLCFSEYERLDLDESDGLRLYVRCCCGMPENLECNGEADIGGETRYWPFGPSRDSDNGGR